MSYVYIYITLYYITILLCKIKTCPLELLSIVLVCSHKMLLYCNQFKSKLSRVFFAFSTRRKVFHILFSHSTACFQYRLLLF